MTSPLKFDFEWVEPADAQGEELRATWARLLILVGEKRVTLNIDEKSQSLRESIYLPLYPLAEWLACNWWVLLGEPFNSKRTSSASYRTRHSLVGAGEGFAIPDLCFEPEGEKIHVFWGMRRQPWAQLRFVDEGSANLSRNDITETLREFIDAVVRRLVDAGVKDTLLQEEWSALSALDREEAKFCSAAGKLGRDPFNISPGESELIVGAASDWDEETLAEVLAAINPHRLKEGLVSLREYHKRLQRHTARFTKILEFKESCVSPIMWSRHDPWQIGYEYAQQLRSWLGASSALASTRKYDRILGLHHEVPSWSHAMETFRGVDAIIVQNKDGFALGAPQQRETHWRFAHYRALFEVIVTLPTSTLALVSAAHSARQKANRAFAAEFLAPAETLRAYFSKSAATEASILAAAEKLGVSEILIAHQLINHRIVSAEDLSWNPFGRGGSFGTRLEFTEQLNERLKR